MKNTEIFIGDVKMVIYDSLDNKTIDIIQDRDKLVLTHQQAIKIFEAINKNIIPSPLTL